MFVSAGGCTGRTVHNSWRRYSQRVRMTAVTDESLSTTHCTRVSPLLQSTPTVSSFIYRALTVIHYWPVRLPQSSSWNRAYVLPLFFYLFKKYFIYFLTIYVKPSILTSTGLIFAKVLDLVELRLKTINRKLVFRSIMERCHGNLLLISSTEVSPVIEFMSFSDIRKMAVAYERSTAKLVAERRLK